MKKVYEIRLFLLIVTAFLLQSCDRRISRFTEKNQVSITDKQCINKVIAADDSLGKIRNLECKKHALSQTITSYTLAMRKIQKQDCPKEFSKAFDLHIQSWDNILVVTDKYPSIRGEMHDLFKQLEKSKDSIEFKKLQAEIWKTWVEVEKKQFYPK